jgi:hypothetical protein
VRLVFGPLFFKRGEDLCARCQWTRIWSAWRALAVIIGLLTCLGGLAQGQWLLSAIAIPVAAFWWWYASRRLMDQRE